MKNIMREASFALHDVKRLRVEFIHNCIPSTKLYPTQFIKGCATSNYFNFFLNVAGLDKIV